MNDKLNFNEVCRKKKIKNYSISSSSFEKCFFVTPLRDQNPITEIDDNIPAIYHTQFGPHNPL